MAKLLFNRKTGEVEQVGWTYGCRVRAKIGELKKEGFEVVDSADGRYTLGWKYKTYYLKDKDEYGIIHYTVKGKFVPEYIYKFFDLKVDIDITSETFQKIKEAYKKCASELSKKKFIHLSAFLEYSRLNDDERSVITSEETLKKYISNTEIRERVREVLEVLEEYLKYYKDVYDKYYWEVNNARNRYLSEIRKCLTEENIEKLNAICKRLTKRIDKMKEEIMLSKI